MNNNDIVSFLFNLSLEISNKSGIQVLNPYQHAETKRVCETFFNRYYADSNPRTMLLGINPGRFGSGITGIGFTDPVQLEDICDIPNSFHKKAELSSTFIYRVILAFGGPERFYKHFYISAVSPLGFVQGNKNMNYYDTPHLREKTEHFINHALKTQLKWHWLSPKVISIGKGKNEHYLQKWSQKEGHITHITALDHPRFIMQYKRRKIDEYIKQYVDLLESYI